MKISKKTITVNKPACSADRQIIKILTQTNEEEFTEFIITLPKK